MYKTSDFQKEFYNPGEAAKIIGVSLQSIHKYDRDGKLKTYRSEGGHRRIKREDLISFLDKKGVILDDTKRTKRDVIYARVPSQEKEMNGELDRQAMYLIEHAPNLQNPLVMKEVGSGLDESRKQIQELIQMVLDNEVNNVYVTRKDRLTRFGFHYLETVFLAKDVNIIVVRDENETESVDREWADDMMSLMSTLSNKSR